MIDGIETPEMMIDTKMIEKTNMENTKNLKEEDIKEAGISKSFNVCRSRLNLLHSFNLLFSLLNSSLQFVFR